MIWKLIAKVCAKPVVANWLVNRAMKTPYVHIYGKDGETYMERYWLFNPYPYPEEKRENWFPISIRIHHIMRKDEDRELHDHPWNARTIILQGGYIEVREGDKEYVRLSGDTAKLKYGEYHRIVFVPSGGTWTLFITGKYRGTWGFLVDGVKVQWRQYLGL